MAKDWEHYKKQHLEDEISGAKRWHEVIENMIESPIERIAFMHLVFMSKQLFGDYEVVIRPQYKYGPYTIDLVVHHWDTQTWIAIECDGHDFHEKTKEQAAHDKKRDRFITKGGFVLLRYTGSQVCNEPLEIYEDVASIIMERKKLLENKGE